MNIIVPNWDYCKQGYLTAEKTRYRRFKITTHMSFTNIFLAKTTVSMTELRRNPSILMQLSDNQPIAILSSNKPIAYLLSTKAYEKLLELIDDASLIETAMARQGGKTVKTKI